MLTVFVALGSGFGAVAYVRWIRPIPPKISLRRLKVSRPVIPLEPLRRVVAPAISLDHLMPAPMTLAPGLPVGPLKPVPIVTRPPAARPRRVALGVMAPSEILEHLKREPAPPVEPGILIKRMEQVIRPMKPSISLERLKGVTRPLLKPGAPTEEERPICGKEPEPFLERLKREVFREEKRGEKKRRGR